MAILSFLTIKKYCHSSVIEDTENTKINRHGCCPIIFELEKSGSPSLIVGHVLLSDS